MISLVHPAGWGANEELSSAQISTLDANIVKCLDGTGGGTYAPTAPLIITGQGLNPRLAAGVWPNFGADGGAIRTFPRAISPTPVAFSTMGAITNPSFVPGDGLGDAFWRDITHCLPDGAIITSIQLRVKIATGRVSLPTLFPRLSVYRFDVTASTSVLLNSGDFGAGEACAIASGGTVGTYEALGNASATYAVNQNGTVDKAAHTYFVTAIDEGGGGHIAGNQFSGFVVTYTAADTRPV